MIRLATINDAEQLYTLNDEFNGSGDTTIESIRESLACNKQEVVIVSEENDILIGFACVQLKKSFCYAECSAEITEVFVEPEYRKRGIARAMISFAEGYCGKKYSIHKFELLTERNNSTAQSVYGKLGYKEDEEIHFIRILPEE